MRSRVVFVLAVSVLAMLVTPASAKQVSASLPVYPGGKVQMELNLTESDLLPAIRRLVTMITVFAPPHAKKDQPYTADGEGVNAEDESLHPNGVPVEIEAFTTGLQQALAGLRRVSVMRYQVAPTTQADEIANFYLGKLGLTKGWQRSVRLEKPDGVFRLYTKPNLEGVFGLIAKKGSVVAFQTEGRIDLIAISELTDVIMEMISQREKDRNPGESPDTEKEDGGSISHPSQDADQGSSEPSQVN